MKEAEGYRLFPSPRKGSTGYKGVSKDPRPNRAKLFQAIGTRPESKFLGSFAPGIGLARGLR